MLLSDVCRVHLA